MFATTIRVSALAVVLLATGLVHREIPPTPSVHKGEAFVPRPELAKAVALGFDAVLADYYWLRAVQVVGGAHLPAEHATLLGRLIDVVTTLDPWVDHPYRFAAVWLTESEEQVREGIRLLERGIEHHPDDWRNWFYKGFNHFYYLHENEEASEALEGASRIPGSPMYLPRLVARLRSEAADLEVAEAFLREVLGRTEDERKRAEYQQALDEIEVERRARFLERMREAYRELHGRDIERVEDLLAGAHPILRALPSAEPSSLPAPLRRGSQWVLDEEGRVVSTYYDHRYEVHRDFWVERKRARWREEDRAGREEGSRGG